MRPAIVLALVFVVVAPTRAQEKPAKRADLNDHGNFLTAEGVWRADNLNEKTENAFPSVARLECYKRGGKDLVGSDAYCMQASAQIVSGHPDIGVTYYPVIAWDKEKVNLRVFNIAFSSIPTAPTNLLHSQRLIEAFDTNKAFDTN